MTERILKLFQPAPTAKPVQQFERYRLRARLDETVRERGHRGHFVELDLFDERDGRWDTCCVLSDTVLEEAIILLQQALEWMGKTEGVSLLPTVRWKGGSYHFDARRGELCH